MVRQIHWTHTQHPPPECRAAETTPTFESRERVTVACAYHGGCRCLPYGKSPRNLEGGAFARLEIGLTLEAPRRSVRWCTKEAQRCAHAGPATTSRGSSSTWAPTRSAGVLLIALQCSASIRDPRPGASTCRDHRAGRGSRRPGCPSTRRRTTPWSARRGWEPFS